MAVWRASLPELGQNGRTSTTLLLTGVTVAIVALLISLTTDAEHASDTTRLDPIRSTSTQQATAHAPVPPHPDLPTTLDDERVVRPLLDPPATVFETWVQQLRYGADTSARCDAADALADWVPGEAEAVLISAGRFDRDADVRASALLALDGASSLAVVKAWSDALADPDTWVQDAGENGLFRLDDTRIALGAVAELCRAEDRELRIRAAELLDEMVSDHLPWDEIWDGPVSFSWAPPSPFEDAK